MINAVLFGIQEVRKNKKNVNVKVNKKFILTTLKYAT